MNPKALRVPTRRIGRVSRTALIATIAVIALLGCQAQPPQAASAPTPRAAATSSLATTPTAVSPSVPDPDYWPTTGWKSSTPEQQGMDSARLAALFDAIDRRGLNLHSVLVIRNGYLVTEAYFASHGPEIKQEVMSVTKSVSGMLTGIAMSQGHIQSASESVLSFFPDRTIANADDNKRKMTLENLLTLATGFNCGDDNGDLGRMMESPDWVQFTLDLPMAAAPGNEFHYCSPAVHLVSPILKQATGKSEVELANAALFAPLGIPPAGAAGWDTDPQGIPQGFGGLRLTPADMAKLGFLYLHGGSWDGKEVVPASWVATSLAPHSTEASTGRGYGYLIWLYPQGYQSMMGLGGQDIHIIPDKNMVVVFTAAMDIPTHDKEVIQLLDEFIVPAATSDQPLAENPTAQAQLQASIAAAAAPKRPAPPLPAVAAKISGKVYNLDPNPNGWKTFSLTFTEGSAEAIATVDGNATVRIGLDNAYRRTEVGPGAAVAVRGHWEEGGVFVFDANTLGSFQEWHYRAMPGSQLLIEGTERVTGARYTMVGQPAS